MINKSPEQNLSLAIKIYIANMFLWVISAWIPSANTPSPDLSTGIIGTLVYLTLSAIFIRGLIMRQNLARVFVIGMATLIVVSNIYNYPTLITDLIIIEIITGTLGTALMIAALFFITRKGVRDLFRNEKKEPNTKNDTKSEE